MTVESSTNFKKMTIKAVLSIVLFIIVYLLLIILAIGLTFLCGYLGIMLIAAKPTFITLILGAGLVSMGVLILVFLVKFLFKEHIVDRSHLVEITKEQEPELFKFINEIVKEVKTDFPKKIYLSSDVNASVFYDSSFWSMILPIKKNLQIGLGLVNSVSKTEFKAILSHEFGHFSQRTMKVGSFVYNVNQIIYNMLYDNKSYENLAQEWASVSNYFVPFVRGAVKGVQGIQWVLRKVYEVVNLNYMALSREMEFHADEVAANVAGSMPLITSLLRLDLADNSYNTVLNYYNSKIDDSIKTKNIYPQQQFVLNFLANEIELPVQNNLPQVSLDHLSRYNKSKLVVKNQWASHPSTEDRIRELNRLNIIKETDGNELATILFKNISNLQTRITEKLFSNIKYSGPIINKDNEQFIEDYTKEYRTNSFGKLFNNYYDNKNPSQIDIEKTSTDNQNFDIKSVSLFSTTAVDLIYTSLALEGDINTLKQIENENYKIESFSYDGTKYSILRSNYLISKLEKELKTIKEKINENDINIYKYFLFLAINQGKETEFKFQYQSYLKMDKDFENNGATFIKLINASNFIQETTPFERIEQNLKSLKNVEIEFKKLIKDILDEDIFQSELTAEMKEMFRKYISKDWIYFNKPEYNNDALNILFTSMSNFQLVSNKTYFKIKKDLLEYFEELESQQNKIK